MKIHNNEYQSQNSTRRDGKGPHLEADGGQRNRPDHLGATGDVFGDPSDPIDRWQPASEIRIANAHGYYEIEPDQEDPDFRTAMDRQLAEARNKPRIKKKRKSVKRNPLATWLRKRISHLNYGDKGIDEDGKTRAYPELDIKKFIDQYNHFRYGASLTNKQFQDHFDNLDTFYFWADHRSATAVILAMIDIDVHDGVGTKAGA